MDRKERIGFTIGFVIFIGIGLLAVLKPDFMEGYEAMGPRSSLKQLFADYWGTRLGLAMMVLGALALVGLRQTE
jgi:hypothetical protein